jgi:hypothetical protein
MQLNPMTGPRFCASGSTRSANLRPLDGLRRGGYKLVYTDTPGDFLAGSEEQRKRINLTFSIGVELDDKEKDMQGVVSEVIWDSPHSRQASLKAIRSCHQRHRL